MRAFFLSLLLVSVMSASAQLTLHSDIEIPDLPDFTPLPAMDEEFSEEIARLVEACGLDVMTPASENPDEEDEWSSVCVVDLSDPANPRVGGWRADNMVYPASAYKMYVLGEAVRQICEGELTLSDTFVIPPHNVRGTRLAASQEITLSETLRLVCEFSDNTAANMAIDIVDRQRASALMRALGCEGSDITRKFLTRNLEDPGYAEVPGTETCALHMATFLWAAESGAIGGGRGRGLIRGYLGMIQTAQDRVRAGLPASATLMSKTGTWNIFTSEAALVEDGETRYILAILTATDSEVANPRIAQFAVGVHALLGGEVDALPVADSN